MDVPSEDNQRPLPVVELHNDPSASSCVTSLREVDCTRLSQPVDGFVVVDVEHHHDHHHHHVDSGGDGPTTSVLESDRRVQVVVPKCTFHIIRKRRNCNAPTVGGRNHCVEHSYLLGDASLRKRIACPLDSKHSVYEDHLKAHLKKCNAREGLKPVCYVHNINSGEEDGADPAKYKVTLRTAGEDEVTQLLDKIRQLSEEHVAEVRSDVRFHPVLQEEADKSMNGHIAQKHIQQQASLVSHMARLGLLADHRCFIEFGAGKGGLSHWVQLASSHFTNTQYLLIDRGNNRYKKDSFHKGVDQGPTFERLKMDIEHLNLGKVPTIQECTRPIVGMGKHLCGSATDLMLRCLVNTLPKEGDEQKDCKQSARSALGIVLALCCHHQCDWRSYVGKAFMTRLGISARQFHLMCCLSSWAVCGSPSDKVQDSSREFPTKGPGHPRYSHIPVKDREEIGYQCKQLINLGRVAWLRDHAFDAETVQYVDSGFSLENVVLLATRKTGQV